MVQNKQNFLEKLFTSKKKTIEDEVVLIRKRLGWIIFWLIIIALAISNLADLL